MKALRYLILATSLLLSGCGSTNNSKENDIISSTEPVSTETSENNSSSERVIPEEVKTSQWGEEAALASYDAIGAVVPYFEADHFDYQVTTDDFGDPAIWFYLYYETQDIAESKITDYAYAAWEADSYECVIQKTRFTDPDTFTYWDQNVLYADKDLSDYRAIEIQALASIKSYNGVGMGCLGLFCFNYIPNPYPNEFPTYAVSTIIGDDNNLPMFGYTDLEYSFSFFMVGKTKCLQILITSKNRYFELEEEYFYALLTRGFGILQFNDMSEEFTDLGWVGEGEYPDYDDYMSYYASPEDLSYMVYFQYDIYNQVFQIEIMPK